MARKPRAEIAGGLYHVITRQDPDRGQAFDSAILRLMQTSSLFPSRRLSSISAAICVDAARRKRLASAACGRESKNRRPGLKIDL